MQPLYQAVLLSWSVPPAASFALALTAVVYLRGWFLLRRAGLPFLPLWRAISFLAGLLSLWVALASPLDTFSGFVLTAHMVQHMILMMVAPPLILLGAPLIPLVRGLPIFAAREFAGPFLNWRLAQQVGNTLTNPIVAMLLMGAAMFAWHTPRLYELALASSSWHELEHACFFLASLLFWWPVIQPWPSRAQWPRWAMVPYLLIGDLQNTALSAILVFSDSLLYPSYANQPRLFGFSALHDQAASGAIMWVLGSLAYMVPAILIAVECLQYRHSRDEKVPIRKLKSSWLDAAFAVPQRFSFANRFWRTRLSSRAVETISFVVLFAIAGIGLAALASGSSNDDDDQVVRLQQQSGPFSVAVFSPAGDLEAGPAGFSVLLQDRDTQQILLDATVDVTAQRAGDSQAAASVRASTADSDNKLLQSAELSLPTAGDWTLHLAIQRTSANAEFSLPLQVVKPAGGIAFPWSYLILLGFAALLLFSCVRRHRTVKAVPIKQPVSTLQS
jgi:cytochrome c oxidase assembly factor CtaG